MIALAVGLGVLGFFALRRAKRRCYAGGYGWYGPWASVEGYDDDDCGEHGHHHGRGGGPPWARYRRGRGRWRGGRGGRRWMLHAALARIDATPAQERVIVDEIDKLVERVHVARGGLRDVRADLAAALRGPALDDAALGAVLGRVDGAMGDARSAAIEALRTIHAVLDDNQRNELAEMIDRGRGGSGGRGHGVRMGPYR